MTEATANKLTSYLPGTRIIRAGAYALFLVPNALLPLPMAASCYTDATAANHSATEISLIHQTVDRSANCRRKSGHRQHGNRSWPEFSHLTAQAKNHGNELYEVGRRNPYSSGDEVDTQR
jgi:hypothetical protein